MLVLSGPDVDVKLNFQLQQDGLELNNKFYHQSVVSKHVYL